MNFLAHLYLAKPTAESRIGNMLGDFVTPDMDPQFSPEIQKGIAMHRAVDRFTDSHPIVRISQQRIDKRFRHLKGIMVDIFYDHFLAKNWQQYSDVPLEEFAREVYTQFTEHYAILPPKMQRMMPIMIRGNWLVTYRELRGIRWVLKGMSGRLSSPNLLGEGIVELKKNYSELEADFFEFFEELRTFSHYFHTSA
jgi:acyl carrier protein phosphodiesterase